MGILLPNNFGNCNVLRFFYYRWSSANGGGHTAAINFELHPEANPESRMSSLKRFQPNPLPNWGPKMKAHTTQADMERKRKKNQGKHQQKRHKRGQEEVTT